MRQKRKRSAPARCPDEESRLLGALCDPHLRVSRLNTLTIAQFKETKVTVALNFLHMTKNSNNAFTQSAKFNCQMIYFNSPPLYICSLVRAGRVKRTHVAILYENALPLTHNQVLHLQPFIYNAL